jgi:4'-phosphopantetheinyl transferase
VPSLCVDVWLADIDAAGEALDELERLFPLLTADERNRASGLEPLLTKPWTRTRVALRMLLASRLGPESARSAFLLSPAGKPAFGSGGLHFSISHSDRFALIALSSDGPVGVDIEARSQVKMHPDRQQAIEAAAIALAPDMPLPTPGDATRFLQAWTRLEALAKATGGGVSALLTSLGIRGPAATLGGREAKDVSALLTADGCALRITDLRLGCAASVAGPSSSDVVLHRLPTALSDLIDLSGLAG